MPNQSRECFKCRLLSYISFLKTKGIRSFCPETCLPGTISPRHSCFTQNKSRFQMHQIYKPVKNLHPKDVFLVLDIHSQDKIVRQANMYFLFFLSLYRANQLSVRAKQFPANSVSGEITAILTSSYRANQLSVQAKQFLANSVSGELTAILTKCPLKLL